ncbi:hypothetical protein CDL15_Pgr009462 [Punica granatum]|uniref:Uncharacterized protein n=1 Tax=Punica granatum TaxID=22663 RepID=A0A218WTI1_PUNGR|nr:hypothetical protein CDL15_Pgr009462 [Punica granatum]PKI55935.1 hypothetical protein CRG98_023667 [Punica granatum]
MVIRFKLLPIIFIFCVLLASDYQFSLQCMAARTLKNHLPDDHSSKGQVGGSHPRSDGSKGQSSPSPPSKGTLGRSPSQAACGRTSRGYVPCTLDPNHVRNYRPVKCATFNRDCH